MSQVEIKSAEFPKQIHLEYEEMDINNFFEEILPFVRTPHKCYHVENHTIHILIGVTHPIEIKITSDKESVNKLVEKLRLHGFKKAKWEWK
jgi:hypothetical protein